MQIREMWPKHNYYRIWSPGAKRKAQVQIQQTVDNNEGWRIRRETNLFKHDGTSPQRAHFDTVEGGEKKLIKLNSLFRNTLVDLLIRDCIQTLRIYPAWVFEWLLSLRLLLQRAARSSVGAQPPLLTCPNHIKHSHSPHFFVISHNLRRVLFFPFSLFFSCVLYHPAHQCQVRLFSSLACNSSPRYFPACAFDRTLWRNAGLKARNKEREEQFESHMIYRKKVVINFNFRYLYSGEQKFCHPK